MDHIASNRIECRHSFFSALSNRLSWSSIHYTECADYWFDHDYWLLNYITTSSIELNWAELSWIHSDIHIVIDISNDMNGKRSTKSFNWNGLTIAVCVCCFSPKTKYIWRKQIRIIHTAWRVRRSMTVCNSIYSIDFDWELIIPVITLLFVLFQCFSMFLQFISQYLI